MSKTRKLIAAAVALIAIGLGFLPVVSFSAFGEVVESKNIVDLFLLWRESNVALAIWLCAVVCALVAIVIVNCFSSKKAGSAVSLGLATFGGISMGVISFMAKSKAFPMELGGMDFSNVLDSSGLAGASISYGAICIIICFVAIAVLSCVDLYLLGKNVEAAPPVEQPVQQPVQYVPAPAVKQPMQSGFAQGQMSVFCGALNGACLPMPHMESLVIGRDAELCSLVIEGASVSRKHCVVTYNAVKDTYLLMDVSSNGTYLESGQRIPRNFAMEIRSGLSFYLGTPDNRFRVGK